MGTGSSQEVAVDEDGIFNKLYISFTKSGNLKFSSKNLATDRDAQLMFFTRANIDNVGEEEGKIWYIMDSAWVISWLAFAHFNKDMSPAPGPCTNHRLLLPEYDKRSWKPRPDLKMATKTSTGDYRRVSKEVWDKFCEYYEGCGPAIMMPFKEDPACRESGLYDTSTWTIDNSNFTKYIEEIGDGNKLKNIRPKKAKKLVPVSIKDDVPAGEVKIIGANGAKAGDSDDEIEPLVDCMEDNSVSPALQATGRAFLGADSASTQKSSQISPKTTVSSALDKDFARTKSMDERPSFSMTELRKSSAPAGGGGGVKTAPGFPHDQFFSSNQN